MCMCVTDVYHVKAQMSLTIHTRSQAHSVRAYTTFINPNLELKLTRKLRLHVKNGYMYVHMRLVHCVHAVNALPRLHRCVGRFEPILDTHKLSTNILNKKS